jgi:hypothetical protein
MDSNYTSINKTKTNIKKRHGAENQGPYFGQAKKGGGINQLIGA